MNVTTDGDGAANGLNVGLAEKDFASLVTKTLDVIFRELLALAEMRDPRILLGNVDHVGCKSLEYAEQRQVLSVEPPKGERDVQKIQ